MTMTSSAWFASGMARSCGQMRLTLALKTSGSSPNATDCPLSPSRKAKSTMGEDELISFWEKCNDQLRNLGIRYLQLLGCDNQRMLVMRTMMANTIADASA